ncbi:hypothetical protein ANANG_G00025820 [Anguilla anguilla]|uniref:Uncharacterized protein n=1 Tax=Anguilla anguilla TaxID=7936 RepID=A0A9D3MZ89_ANGAN|nr:hypothetical protein ANANG_G00025820 [Anguilla anguilla]
MASNADSNAVVPAVQANEHDSQKNELTQLRDELNGRLEDLQEKTELCNRILRDLVDLRGILADKNVGDRPVPSTQQDHSH